MSIATIGPEVVIAAVLSVAAEWLPGFREWWAALESKRKAQLMALMVFVTTLGLALFRCYAYDGFCPNWQTFVTELAGVFLIALAANQSVHAIDRTLKA